MITLKELDSLTVGAAEQRQEKIDKFLNAQGYIEPNLIRLLDAILQASKGKVRDWIKLEESARL